jgi:DHA1 family tetracycline resistance protein-like MFS transporter
VCIAIGTGLATPSITGLVSRLTPPSRQGVALGTLKSIVSVARIVGPPATGFITEIAGERVPFVAGAVAAFAALVIAILSRAEPVDMI